MGPCPDYKATSSSDLLPEALYEMYFDMATDKEKDVKAKKRDMSDQVIDWMMGFAMYTATGQLLSHTSFPSRRLSCLHAYHPHACAGIKTTACRNTTHIGDSKPSAAMSQGGAGYLADVRYIQMHAFSFQSPPAVSLPQAQW